MIHDIEYIAILHIATVMPYTYTYYGMTVHAGSGTLYKLYISTRLFYYDPNNSHTWLVASVACDPFLYYLVSTY